MFSQLLGIVGTAKGHLTRTHRRGGITKVKGLEFRQGRSIIRTLRHPEGDADLIRSADESIGCLRQHLANGFSNDLTVRSRMTSGKPDCVRNIRTHDFLHPCEHPMKEGIQWEAYPRGAQILVREVGLESLGKTGEASVSSTSSLAGGLGRVPGKSSKIIRS